MEVEVPELGQVAATLRSRQRPTRGRPSDVSGRRAPAVELAGRLSLGEPVGVAITPDFAAADAELCAFVQAEIDAARYWLVHLACTFTLGDGDPLDKAWLAVELARADGGVTGRPIAWSMSPMRLSRAIEQSRTLKLGADAKLAQAGVEVARTVEGSVVYLEALHLRESTPTWEFTRTDADEIRGATLLALVVRAPVGAVVDGSVELTAALRSRRFGVIPFRAELPDRPRLTFRLAP